MYKNLQKTFERLSRLNHLGSITRWDEAAMMPAGGGEARAKALAELNVISHELITDPRMGDWIAQAERESLDEWQKANVREIKRSWQISNSIAADLVEKQSLAGMRAEQSWRIMRADNNWKDFRPLLEEVVVLAREEAQQLGSKMGLSPYNALVNKYEPGATAEKIEKVFAGLKSELPPIVDQILEKQKTKNTIFPKAQYPIEQQRKLGLEMMKAIGFDFNHGRLDVSHHPFCGGVPQDTRITTRYKVESFFDSLMGVIHETGHACYEQNLPTQWIDQPVGGARGMATHESQSLFMEMQMARNKSFLQFAAPIVKSHFHNSVDDVGLWTAENLFSLASHVERSYIRVDADEATYPMHVILRFELERALIEGRLEVRDLPEAWNEKMQSYLGLSTLGNDKDGCMQDVHWPSGSFGYFPDYTLGAMMAAQLSQKMRKEIPDRNEQWARGDFKATFNWLKEKVWTQSSRFPSADDLLVHATGEPLNATHFISHLKEKYLS